MCHWMLSQHSTSAPYQQWQLIADTGQENRRQKILTRAIMRRGETAPTSHRPKRRLVYKLPIENSRPHIHVEKVDDHAYYSGSGSGY